MNGILKEASSTLVNRTAIDSSGSIGCLYDGYRDQIFDITYTIDKSKPHHLHEFRRCEIFSCKKNDGLNIFQMVNIDDESRLNVLLNLTEKKGIAAIYDCLNPVTEYTRIFCCTYVERIQKQPNTVIKDPQKLNTKLRSNKSETHIITQIEWGIDVAAILELPSDYESVEKIDYVLKRICESLKTDNDSLLLEAKEKNILDQIIYTKVYSNTNEINLLLKLYDVCTYIQRNKKSTAKYPISYGIQPIAYLCPQYSHLVPKFVTLTGDRNRRVQQYLLSIILDVKRLKRIIKVDVARLLSTYLSKQRFEAEKQCLDVENKCTQEVDHFQKLVIAIRNGQAESFQIDDALKHQDRNTIRKKIVDINQSLNELSDKGHFISDLERQHFKYVDASDYDLDNTDNNRNIENRLVTNLECERVLCSNDLLNKCQQDQLRQLQYELMEERRNKPELRLIYADFTYCNHQLKHMIRLPLDHYNNQSSIMTFTKTHASYTPSDGIKTSSSFSIKDNHSIPLKKELQAGTPISYPPYIGEHDRVPIHSTTIKNADTIIAEIQTNSSLSEEMKMTPRQIKQDEYVTSYPVETKPLASILSPTEMINSRSTSTKTLNTNVLNVKTHTNGLLTQSSKPTLSLSEQYQHGILPKEDLRIADSKPPQLSTEEQVLWSTSRKTQNNVAMVAETHTNDSLIKNQRLIPSPSEQYERGSLSKQRPEITNLTLPQSSTERPASGRARRTDSVITKTPNYSSFSVKPKVPTSEIKDIDSLIGSLDESQITDMKFAKLQEYISSQANLHDGSSSTAKKSNTNQEPITIQTAESMPMNVHKGIHDLFASPTTKPTSPSSSPLSSKDDDVINILLLGETGVGKSTFINAFANYLTFNTLEQAEKNPAVVLIPVSFLITVGDNFNEYIVKFGNNDETNNEDFEHPGQSVTQHCRSYLFNLKHDQKRKFCIIDTPGFGDTRGLVQDDYNMAHIQEYIKNLSHLNAVCFLLKPNESRLNIFLRSCITQLFTLLDAKNVENILFCFTNSRSTFYTPGNTAPLLKKMLNSLSTMNIPFGKDNIFCFDSESFRYLVSLQNRIPFSIQDREEYEISWTKSVIEVQRLVQYICTVLKPFHILT